MNWISVTDKLPEKITTPKPQGNGNTLYFYEKYLVYGYHDNIAKSETYLMAAYRPCSVCWYFQVIDFPNSVDFTVTHWMNLPEPPKE